MAAQDACPERPEVCGKSDQWRRQNDAGKEKDELYPMRDLTGLGRKPFAKRCERQQRERTDDRAGHDEECGAPAPGTASSGICHGGEILFYFGFCWPLTPDGITL